MSLESLNLLYWLLHSHYYPELVTDPEEELSLALPPGAQWKCQGNDFNLASSPDYVLRIQKVAAKTGEDRPTKFEMAKADSGSIIAFHGTSAENLHSIMRCGLLNLSNTTLQRNGAIFGEGIYLSTDIRVALSFSKSKEGWEHSCLGERLKYLLVCEIARGEKVLHIEKSGQKASSSNSPGGERGSYIVVQNSDLVKVRYIFVYIESRIHVKQVGIRKENSDSRAHPAIGRSLLGRQDWCKVLLVLYVALLLGVSYFK
eukprot:Gb_24116 [translate_table: standard]